jgi:hypothetical protein
MQCRYLSREALLHFGAANLERRARMNFYAAHDLALACNGQRFQTLSRTH